MKSVKNYVYTERAHFMCPNMHFGIMAKIDSHYEEGQLRQSIDILQKAHPFLQSLIAEETDTGRLYYQIQDCLNIPVLVKDEAALWQQDYEEISVRGWNVKKECLLKVVVYPNENGFQLLFIAHHLLCDGRGLLQLAEEFAEHYANGIMPQFAPECLIQGLNDLPSNSDLPLISKLIVGDANRKWKKEGQKVMYGQYSIFERAYIQKCKMKREIFTICNQELENIQALCKQHGITVNDYLIAKMMLEENTNKVVIAADIRNQTKCYRQGAMGNYSTAFSVSVKKNEKNIISLAKRAASQVINTCRHPQKEMLVLACYIHMQPELIDAVAISTLGDFESKAGTFVGRNMFGFGSQNGYSITNLGKIESNIIAEAIFIPPASPANKKTWGVLTVNNHMKICASNLITEQ
ncbi:hypothetical protein [Murimonas intestini]|uniref:hypothetical protein n=1 Tax=Murimonas intestini TaxID=1337051 RepID=UPI001651C7A1|nr:hypothetical protein [Murimonas intestini]